jgi:hypothetical protein
VFGIQRGVSINLLVKRPVSTGQAGITSVIRYARVDEYWRKEQKYQYLEQNKSAANVPWQPLTPDAKNNWLTAGLLEEFENFPSVSSFFTLASNGLKTNRDEWAYNFNSAALVTNINRTLDVYNQEVARWISRGDKKANLDDFLLGDDQQISWSETLKKHLQAGDYAQFDRAKVRRALYRPFCSQYVYFDDLLNERQYQLRFVFPQAAKDGNRLLWCKVGADWPFFSLVVNTIPDALPQSGSRCFPFYTYAEDGTNRRENITDWALEQFRSHYGDPSITKWDIFHYVYAVLHHPEYRERYAANLRRELPRIPFVSAPSSTLSSRAESRDPVPAGVRHGREEESFAGTGPRRVHGENTYQGQVKTQPHTGSFDSVTGLASEPSHSAQDDRVVGMSEPSHSAQDDRVVGMSEPSHSAQDDRVVGISEPSHSAQDDRVGVMGEPSPSAQDDRVVGMSEPSHSAQDDRVVGMSDLSHSAQNDRVVGMSKPSLSAQDDRVVGMSEPSLSAHDDRVVVMSDRDIFRGFVGAGQRLAEIHVHYEHQPEYPVIKQEKEGEKLDYRVTKMP